MGSVRFCEVVCKYKLPVNSIQEYQNMATTLMSCQGRHIRAQCWSQLLHALSKNRYLNLEESCMITQFTGKIIKSLVSFLSHYTGYSSRVLSW